MIKKILVSQPKPSSEKSPYFDIAERYGVDIVFHPFIKVEGISAREFRQEKISLSEHTAVVFTSRHGTASARFSSVKRDVLQTFCPSW